MNQLVSTFFFFYWYFLHTYMYFFLFHVQIWSDPELVSGMSNPKVQAAIMDIQKNPMNMMQHMSDPEVSKVLMKMQQMFAPGMSGGPSA